MLVGRVARLISIPVLIAFLLIPSAAAAQPTSPRISAPEAIVIDGWTGAVLWARDPAGRRDPASTVKLMTALIVMLRRLPLQHVVTVTPEAASYAGSSAGLVAGEQMTVWNLLHGMLMPSGNDAAVALADASGGSLSNFIRLMNAEAVRLGLRETRYLSANGFDMPGQYTSARDLATLARIDMGFPALATIMRTRWWTARSADGRFVHRWANTNKLLWLSRSIDGVKTGTTPGAGACLVSSVRENGEWIIEVNLGSTAADRFHDGAVLLNYGLAVDSPPPWAR